MIHLVGCNALKALMWTEIQVSIIYRTTIHTFEESTNMVQLWISGDALLLHLKQKVISVDK